MSPLIFGWRLIDLANPWPRYGAFIYFGKLWSTGAKTSDSLSERYLPKHIFFPEEYVPIEGGSRKRRKLHQERGKLPNIATLQLVDCWLCHTLVIP